MALISGLIESFSSPNYEGPLYNITPEDTPLLSAIGGLYGGDGVNTPMFRWQEFDLRDAAVAAAKEGIAAPASTGRSRSQVFNVCQIIHESVDVSYTKQASFNAITGADGVGGKDATMQGNPVVDEFGWQVTQRLKEIARDCEYAIINGTFVDDTDINTARKTRGLLAAITTNVENAGGPTITLDASSSSDDILLEASHGLEDDDRVQFLTLTGGAGLVVGQTYFVVTGTTGTFQLSATQGGAAIDFTTDISAATLQKVVDPTAETISSLMQTVWDNGGIREQETATLVANSHVKRHLTEAFLSGASTSASGFRQDNRNVGGVNLQTFDTDFGRVNVMLNRYMPSNKLMVVSLDELRLKWLEQEKGRLFAEPLGVTGSLIESQIYGEWGLMYGNERAHGEMTGLANAS